VNDLERFFEEHQGGKIQKWMHYFEIYERHFARYRGTDVHILEIGVAHGGSLKMWREYFGPKAHVYGVDIEPSVKKLEEDQVQIFVGDQTDVPFLESVAAAIPRIDILIDDGGHTMRQQEVTFRALFPLVAEDGVYLCEDLHTSYWGDFGGGYKRVLLRQVAFDKSTRPLWRNRVKIMAADTFQCVERIACCSGGREVQVHRKARATWTWC